MSAATTVSLAPADGEGQPTSPGRCLAVDTGKGPTAVAPGSPGAACR